jgi:hypothetical protein
MHVVHATLLRCDLRVSYRPRVGDFEREIEAYDVSVLRTRFERGVRDGLDQALDRTGLFLLGEVHGVAETPLVLYTLFHAFGFRALALEWETELRQCVQRFLGGDPLELPFAPPDGRVTAGHFALLRQLSAEGVLEQFVFMDRTTNDWIGEWDDRDAGMAEELIRERRPEVRTLVVAGGFHVHTEPQADGRPLGERLASAVPGLATRQIRYLWTGGRHLCSLASFRRTARLRRDRSGRFVFEVPRGRPGVLPAA